MKTKRQNGAGPMSPSPFPKTDGGPLGGTPRQVSWLKACHTTSFQRDPTENSTPKMTFTTTWPLSALMVNFGKAWKTSGAVTTSALGGDFGAGEAE